MKKFLIPLILIPLLLAACTGGGTAATPDGAAAPEVATQPQPGEAATPEVAAQPEATATLKPQPTTSLIGPMPSGPQMECTLVGSQPAAPAELVEIFGVKENDWVYGPENAVVTIVEYSDFQCPYCARFASVMAQLKADYPDDIRLVYRHFPLASIHDKALMATQAAEAAGLQGKFWQMHDFLFANSSIWSQLPVDQFPAWLV